jgi:hypothetical protein
MLYAFSGNTFKWPANKFIKPLVWKMLAVSEIICRISVSYLNRNETECELCSHSYFPWNENIRR